MKKKELLERIVQLEARIAVLEANASRIYWPASPTIAPWPTYPYVVSTTDKVILTADSAARAYS